VSDREWGDEFTPDVLEQIIERAVAAGDMEAVEVALGLLAVRAPARCELIVETLKLGVAMARMCDP
jgi:hypothetical protein